MEDPLADLGIAQSESPRVNRPVFQFAARVRRAQCRPGTSQGSLRRWAPGRLRGKEDVEGRVVAGSR